MILIKKIVKAALVFSAIAVTGCATTSLTQGGEKIRTLQPDEVTSCKELGKSQASVTATALGLARPIETLTKELNDIARNSAANMGGDTIVPLTIIKEGQQTFIVYKCINPNG